MTDIWILNVGDLKFLETPLEYFMQLAYDSDRWPLGTASEFLRYTAERDFGERHAAEIADIWALYSVRVSSICLLMPGICIQTQGRARRL